MRLTFFTTLFLLLSGIFYTSSLQAQFQRDFGTSFDNTFTKVIQAGTNLYVLGSDKATTNGTEQATVTCIDANGNLCWTRRLDIPSVWADGVLTANGADLFVVGYTLPFDASAKSLMGVIKANGSFDWVNSYDVNGREAFTRVALNSANAGAPYYVLGFQFDPGNSGNATWDDVNLLTVSEKGVISSKKKISAPSDDEYARALLALPNGDILIAGNRGNEGVLLRFDKNGTSIGGAAPTGINFTFNHITPAAGGGFYAVGQTFPTAAPYLIRFDADLVNIWQRTLPGLSAATQVWEDPNVPGALYVSVTGLIGGKNRTGICKLNASGTGATTQWARYFDQGETSYTGGSTRLLTGSRIAFVDGRLPASGGFGAMCAFASVSDLNLTSCMTKNADFGIQAVNILFNGPVSSDFTPEAIPSGSMVPNSLTAWQERNLCSPPCSANFTAQPLGINPCGLFQFNNTSTGAMPAVYAWNFGDPAGGANNTSALQNPTHQFSSCGVFNVCLTITCADGTVSTICQSVSVTDQTPPTIMCPPNTTVSTLPGVCYYQGNIPQPTGADNCGGAVTFICSWLTPTQSILVSPQTQFAKGANTISCIAKDACGNDSQPCNFTLTVQDKEAPKITCPLSISVLGAVNAQGQCKAIVNNLAPTVSDNCPMTTVTYSVAGATTASGANDAGGTMFMQGVSTVTYTATDMGGNKATCSFTVTVNCPPDCVCIPNGGGFTNMSYRPNSGPNQPVACGQTIIWQCALPTFTMSGNFACQGATCPPPGSSIPMFWTLKKGITPIANGPMSGAAFSLSFPGSSFATPGLYTLTLGGICGKDTCLCEIKIETPGCGDCICVPNGGGFTNMSYRPNSGPNQPVACGQVAIWQCALANFSLSGNFACQGATCPPPGSSIPMFWTLNKGGGAPINSGTMSGAAFNLSIPNSSFASPGLYTLTLGGICGKDTCLCEIKIETPGCCPTNNCLNFDGIDDFVNVSSPLGPGPSSFSVGCWFRNERTPGPNSGFFYRLFGWSGTNRFELGDQGGTLQFYSNPTGFVNSSVNIRDNRWHYVVAVYNGSTVSVYLDGDPTPVINTGTAPINAFPANFHIGDWGGGASDPRFWDGCIDEFKVWNLALTPAQTTDAALCGTDPGNANLLLHFDFNQGVPDANNAGLTTLFPVKGVQTGTLFNFTLNGSSGNWRSRGASQLPACQVAPFKFLEGNTVNNTAYRTKIYNGDIYSLSTEGAAGGAVRPALIRRAPNGTTIFRTVFNTPGYFNDFVLMQDSCDILLVGHTPNFAGNNRSFVARVNGINGNIIWQQTFNLAQRESFTRIMLSDNPAQSAFPYVILGILNNGGTADDVQLFTMNGAGSIGSAMRYNTGGDDEFTKDLAQIQGEYLMAGNIPARTALVFTNSLLTPTRAFAFQAGPYLFDMEPLSNGNQLLIAGNWGNNAWLAKINVPPTGAPTLVWSKQFPGIASFRKATIRPNGDIHAVGMRTLPSGASVNVVLRARDTGPSLVVNWLKMIQDPAETNWILGDIVHYNGQQVFYTDGRLNAPNTFGNFDILKVLDDNDFSLLSGCITTEMPKPTDALFAINPINVPRNPQQMPFVRGGTNTFVPLPMRPYCAGSPCDCAYKNFAFTIGQTIIQKNFNCGAAPIDLPCPGQAQPVYFSGKLMCMGNCAFAGISWVVKDPTGGPLLTGGSTANPAFSIPITLSMTQMPGVYTIELTGKCGTKECKCIIQFKVNPCPKPCSCVPLSTFIADVNAGFNYFKFPAPSCKMQFTPKNLTNCDKVEWKVTKAGNLAFTVVGNTVGNTPFQYTFPTDQTQYVVCMTVTRTVPGVNPPQSCSHSRCYTVDLDCSVLAGAAQQRGEADACPDGLVRNSGFVQGAEPGGFLSGGGAYGWKSSGGDPEVVMLPGQADTNFIRLRGNRLFSDRLYQDSLPAFKGAAQLSFGFRGVPGTIVAGTELVVRLSKERQDSIICIGECQEIMRFPIPVLDNQDSALWITAFSGDSVAINGRFLTFQVENPFVEDDETLKSAIDIDNICLRPFSFVSTDQISRENATLRLYPNPNAGTFTLELSAPAAPHSRLRIYDPTGRLAHEETIAQGASRLPIRVASLPAGLYFVQAIEDGKIIGITRFVKE